MSSTLPQHKYFDVHTTLPRGGGQWQLTGHSRALERTGFVLTGNGIRVVLDAGVDLATPDASPFDLMLVTHTHIDHCNALPMLLRHGKSNGLVHIAAPRQCLTRLREFGQLSWSVKVDDGDPMPDAYGPPAPLPDDHPCPAPVFSAAEEQSRRWYPVQAGHRLDLGLGKGGKARFLVDVVGLQHTITTTGYVLQQMRRRLRPALQGDTPQETKARVQAARKAGEDVNEEIEVPVLAFLCDTTAAVFAPDAPHAALLNACPIIMIECTYLEPELAGEGQRRGHVVWGELMPHVRRLAGSTTFVLFHFSMRYKDEDIARFFSDVATAGLPLTTEPPAADTADADAGAAAADAAHAPPPALILWLDTGLVSLWLQ